MSSRCQKGLWFQPGTRDVIAGIILLGTHFFTHFTSLLSAKVDFSQMGGENQQRIAVRRCDLLFAEHCPVMEQPGAGGIACSSIRDAWGFVCLIRLIDIQVRQFPDTF